MAYAEGVEVELKVGLAGCGPRGLGHARLVAQMDGARLEAVCDPHVAARCKAAEQFEIPRQYDRIERMLEDAALDAVLVNVPPHLNAEAAMVCLEAGIDTLVEKPPGMRVAETRALRAAAERSGARCMVGLNRRFNPLIAEAKRRVAERGPLVTVVGEFHKNLVEIERQGRIAEPTLARFFYETPIHALDCVRWLAGAPVRGVYSFSQRAVSRHRDAFGALMEFDNGCIVKQLGLHTLIARPASRRRDLVVAMIVARVIDARSKLATARALNPESAVSTLGQILGLEAVDENELYAAMDWLIRRQRGIEQRLARRHLSDNTLMLYDLTSSYFEGHCCPLARRGHSRDGKRGTLQIVFGLLCTADGCPIAVEVFEGSTGDPKTVAAQVDKIRNRFGLQRVEVAPIGWTVRRVLRSVSRWLSTRPSLSRSGGGKGGGVRGGGERACVYVDNFPRSRSRAPSDTLAPHAGRLPFLFATPRPTWSGRTRCPSCWTAATPAPAGSPSP